MRKFLSCFLILVMLLLNGCKGKAGNNQQKVVVYTSMDMVYSQPVFEAFQKETSIKVQAVYDSEATKTIGLVNRLIAEKDNPRADVFWNAETGKTITLKKKGVLAKYISPSASDIPNEFKDTEGYWAGFAARCRVLVYNKNMLKPEDLPKSIFELTDPKWKGRVSLAYPIFGTTATHAAALFVSLGDEKAKGYYQNLKNNNVLLTDGNARCRDRVVDGTVPIAFVDTDDVLVAVQQGSPVDIIWPDKDGIGTLLIPNTVALVKGSPNPETGKKLIDFLLSTKVEEMLANCESYQIPLRKSVKCPASIPTLDKIKAMEVDYEKIADTMEPSAKYLQELFVR